jgi:outer membrane protein assembly factor BamA
MPERRPIVRWGIALLFTLLAYSHGAAWADDTKASAACTEISGRSVSEDFRFTPSAENTKFAQSIPPGSIIASIRIQRLSVFDLEDPEEDKWLYRTANKFHSLTRENVIRNQLLVTEGDGYNQARLKESERILRDLKFIYDATVRPWRQCGDVVDIEVVTRDIWTFTPTVSFSRSGGQDSYALGVRDTNFLGTGKHIVLRAESDEERSGTSFIYKDPAVLGSRWRLRLGITDNDDGFDHSLFIARPFFSVYEKWSAGTILRQFELEQKNWFRGDEVEEFDHEGELYRVFGGLAKDIREDHQVGRWLFGYHRETNDFSFSDSNIPPAELPETRDYSYPFFGYQSIEDEYSEIINVNYLGRTEDFFTGESYQWTLGWSDESLGSTRDQVALNARYGNTFLANAGHLWTAQTSINGFWNVDEESFENLWWTASTHYHMKQSRKWALSGRLRLDYTDGLTGDKQLTLGGDNGLRGYDQNYQVGDRSFVFNLEQRYYSDWHPFRLVRVGAAAFFDVGRAWFNNRDNGSNGDVLADVGIGLRFNSSRADKSSVVHVDLAFPLMSDNDVDSVQFLVTVRDTF